MGNHVPVCSESSGGKDYSFGRGSPGFSILLQPYSLDLFLIILQPFRDAVQMPDFCLDFMTTISVFGSDVFCGFPFVHEGAFFQRKSCIAQLFNSMWK